MSRSSLSWGREVGPAYHSLTTKIVAIFFQAIYSELSHPACYSQKHISAMEALEKTKPRDFAELESKLNSIYLHTETNGASLMAAGSLLNIVDSVMTDVVGKLSILSTVLCVRE